MLTSSESENSKVFDKIKKPSPIKTAGHKKNLLIGDSPLFYNGRLRSNTDVSLLLDPIKEVLETKKF